MDLVLEGTRFALLRPMASYPLHLAIMAGVMVAIMAAATMTMRLPLSKRCETFRTVDEGHS
jgi:hypothetical protein